LNFDLAWQLLFSQFFELDGGLSFGRDVGHHVAVFDDERGSLGTQTEGQ